MASVGVGLIFLAVLVHAIFLYSIFDIYFRSPIIQGMSTYQSVVEPPAKRLVLFVSDGLRADKFFSAHNNNVPNVPTGQLSSTPFLRSIIEKKGAWGVSHTHVPTESRPGHVALVAGFYEDVSAITKGWKENPVEFDSVFNASRFTWSWGSPDILPMLSKGAAGNHVFIHTYSADVEDFASSNASLTDLWVFQKFEEFLSLANHDSELAAKLAKDKIIFFLHLLALDTVGHGLKPASPEYLQSIQIVDAGIQQTVQSIEAYFNHDGKTAYLFTSDHGMTDWGSHGAGSIHETMTPFVAWGAGIRQPQSSSSTESNKFSQEWGLQHLKQSDINQVDVAPLMSSLIGASFPVNSMGILPVDYLSDTAFIAHSYYANMQQLVAQSKAHKYEAEIMAVTLFFSEFSKLSEAEQVQKQKQIWTTIKSGNYEIAISETRLLIDLTLEATHYYRTYNRHVLNCAIVLGFFGWMAYLASIILEKHSSVWSSSLEVQTGPLRLTCHPWRIVAFLALGVLAFIRLHFQDVPYLYHVYFFIPIFLWGFVDYRREIFLSLVKYIMDRGLRNQSILIVVVGICSLEILVWSFFHRELLSVGLWIIALWPLTTQLKNNDKMMCGSWFVSCICLSVFPLMRVVFGKETNYTLV